MTIAGFRDAWRGWKDDQKSRIAAYSRRFLTLLTALYVVVFMLLFGLMAMWSQYQTRSIDLWVHHTLVVRNAITRMQKAMAESERFQRNYIIDGRPSMLQSYRESRDRTWSWLDRVRRLTADNATQQARCVSMESALSGKFAFLDEAIAERQDGGFDAARTVITSGRGEALIDRFSRLADAMAGEEDDLLGVRVARQRYWSGAVWLFLFGASLRDLFIMWLLVHEMWRRGVRRLANLAAPESP